MKASSVWLRVWCRAAGKEALRSCKQSEAEIHEGSQDQSAAGWGLQARQLLIVAPACSYKDRNRAIAGSSGGARRLHAACGPTAAQAGAIRPVANPGRSVAITRWSSASS